MRPRVPDPVKPAVSLFTGEAALFSEVLGRLQERYGAIDFLSEPLSFSSTDYYEEEFGGGLKRKIASFEGLIDPIKLVEIKLYANTLEEEFSRDGKRRVNIDPGYMALEKFVLSSCKNFSHRVYLGDGVYAELTLMYSGTGFKDLAWTYPDYRVEKMKGLLKQIRNRYAFQIGKGLKLG